MKTPELTDCNIRKTTQDLMPVVHPPTGPGEYDIYPGQDIGSGRIHTGYRTLAERLASERVVILEGFVGVLWEDFQHRLDSELTALGVGTRWVDVSSAMLPEDRIEDIVRPFLGGDDPLFGTRFTGTLTDFFDGDKLRALAPDPQAPLNILFGCGAALAGWSGLLVYVDMPKIEVQWRSRAGCLCNLGQSAPRDPKTQYKRFYFVDWVALNSARCELISRIDVFVDAQRHEHPVWATGADIRNALDVLSCNCIRVRPWFEPGPWGGRWILEHIPGLSRNVPNYAWSFELIVPENGVIFESDGRMLEVSFDWLMFHDHRAVLGECASFFGYDFPIRYDFLDTVDGGNLSIQCHPRTSYIRREFGEKFTQDESYYILDCKPGATVHLGFREGTRAGEYRAALEESHRNSTELDVTRYVNRLPASKHDLFLIPGGTVHGSGIGSLVLEISATPYIFTFKMYDWLRMDLDGKPRPLNIQRAMDNLYFERQGDVVVNELVSRPVVIKKGKDWQIVHLPTHRLMFYDVHRLEFNSSIDVSTEGSPHVMSLVEGDMVVVETARGMRRTFNYAETFLLPAAAGRYRLISPDGKPTMVVKTFMKPGWEYR